MTTTRNCQARKLLRKMNLLLKQGQMNSLEHSKQSFQNCAKPPFLTPTNKVAVVSTAGKISETQIKTGLETLKSWQLEVEMGKSVHGNHGYFAGTDSERLIDLQLALDNPEIKAVFCARGGYGTTRIIDQLDFTQFQQNPKWLIGFSDITALHSHIHNFQIQTIHANTLSTFGNELVSEELRKILFGEKSNQLNAEKHNLNRTGNTSGLLIGGNISLLTGIIGTKSDFSTEGKILFLEEVGEPLYYLDRMMTHLLRAGKLDSLAGLAVGGLTEMTNPGNKFDGTVEDIILDKVAQFSYPVAFNLPFGHQDENFPLVCGAEYRLEVSSQGSLLEVLDSNSYQLHPSEDGCN
ncbi:MAG: muramoyltetrapeptide carboxypeptidase [Arenicella sp.]|jgi:muramoyltetrapeptide carboxypeptidase